MQRKNHMTETERCKKIFLDLDKLVFNSNFEGINEYLKKLNTETSTISELKSALIMTDFDFEHEHEDAKMILGVRNEIQKLMDRKKEEYNKKRYMRDGAVGSSEGS